MSDQAPQHPAISTRIIVALLRGLCALPVPLLMTCGRLLAWPLAKLARSRRRVVLANLALCMPELDRAARERLADRNLRSTALSLVESLLAWFGPNLSARMQLIGAEHLERTLAQGRGAILLTPHFTMLEMVPRVMTEAAPPGAPWLGQLTEVVRRHNNRQLEAVVDQGRRRFAATVDKKDVRAMLRVLKANQVLLTAPDQNFSYGAVFAPFFGVPAATTTGNLRLAARSGCPTLPCLIRRNPTGKGWQLRIEAPIANYPSGDPLADATLSNAMVEAAIRQAPEQYLWAHRRFRSRPPGAEALYPDGVLKAHHRTNPEPADAREQTDAKRSN